MHFLAMGNGQCYIAHCSEPNLETLIISFYKWTSFPKRRLGPVIATVIASVHVIRMKLGNYC